MERFPWPPLGPQKGQHSTCPFWQSQVSMKDSSTHLPLIQPTFSQHPDRTQRKCLCAQHLLDPRSPGLCPPSPLKEDRVAGMLVALVLSIHLSRACWVLSLQPGLFLWPDKGENMWSPICLLPLGARRTGKGHHSRSVSSHAHCSTTGAHVQWQMNSISCGGPCAPHPPPCLHGALIGH